MAAEQLSTIQSALEQRIRARLVRQPNRAAVTLNLLRKNAGSGKNLAWDVSVGTDVGQIFEDGEDVSTYNNDTELMATLPWANYGDAFGVTGLAEDAAAKEPTELNNLVMKKLMDAIQRTASKVNVDVISGLGTASPQKILGMTATAGPLAATGTYAGIDRGTYPQWAGNIDSTIGPLSIKRLETMLSNIYDASGRQPTYMVTTTQLFQAYAELVHPQRRWVEEVTIRGETIKLDGGFKALELNGIPIFKDKDMLDGAWLMIDDEHMGVEFLPPAPRVVGSELLAQVPIAGTPQEQAGTVPEAAGLMARLFKLARTGDKSKFQLLARVQLWCDKCNAQGMLKNVSIS